MLPGELARVLAHRLTPSTWVRGRLGVEPDAWQADLLDAGPGEDAVLAGRQSGKSTTAGWLAGPFDQMFTFDRKRTETAVNWGVAAVVWFALGRLLARQEVARPAGDGVGSPLHDDEEHRYEERRDERRREHAADHQRRNAETWIV